MDALFIFLFFLPIRLGGKQSNFLSIRLNYKFHKVDCMLCLPLYLYFPLSLSLSLPSLSLSSQQSKRNEFKWPNNAPTVHRQPKSKGQKGPQCADGWGRDRVRQKRWEGERERERVTHSVCGAQSKWSLKRFQKLNGLHFMSFPRRDSRAEVEPNFWLLVWRRVQNGWLYVWGGCGGVCCVEYSFSFQLPLFR